MDIAERSDADVVAQAHHEGEGRLDQAGVRFMYLCVFTIRYKFEIMAVN